MNNEISIYRKHIIDHLVPLAEKDSRIRLLVCDMGFGVTNKFQSKCPDQIINIGIMEQATVGIAAGMAMTGLRPVVYSIINFLAFRAIEQIRNDVVLQNLDVKFIGTGANDYFSFLGKSHCCGDDDKKIMEMIGMPIYDPYVDCLNKNISYENYVTTWMNQEKYSYIRV